MLSITNKEIKERNHGNVLKGLKENLAKRRLELLDTSGQVPICEDETSYIEDHDPKDLERDFIGTCESLVKDDVDWCPPTGLNLEMTDRSHINSDISHADYEEWMEKVNAKSRRKKSKRKK